MEKGYRYIVIFFLLIVCLVPIGFRKYFGLFPDIDHASLVTHVHALIMIIWCCVLIVQPILILYQKRNLHKLIGWISYFLAPLAILSMVAIMVQSFHLVTMEVGKTEGLISVFFPFSQIVLFAIFYFLSMMNKHRPTVHMRYMIISSVSLLGPTIGRLNFNFLPRQLGGFSWDMIIMDIVIAGFVLFDSIKRKPVRYYALGLSAFLLVHTLTETGFASSPYWISLVDIFL